MSNLKKYKIDFIIKDSNKDYLEFKSLDYAAIPIQCIARTVDEGVRICYLLLNDWNSRNGFPPNSITDLNFVNELKYGKK